MQKRVKPKRRTLPTRCECGGKMLYQFGPGDYVFSCCDTCTPTFKRRRPKAVTP